MSFAFFFIPVFCQIRKFIRCVFFKFCSWFAKTSPMVCPKCFCTKWKIWKNGLNKLCLILYVFLHLNITFEKYPHDGNYSLGTTWWTFWFEHILFHNKLVVFFVFDAVKLGRFLSQLFSFHYCHEGCPWHFFGILLRLAQDNPTGSTYWYRRKKPLKWNLPMRISFLYKLVPPNAA